MKGLRELLGIESDRDVMTPQLQMSIALARLSKPIYGGTVPDAVVQRRRAANRRARASRRINRRSR